MKKRNLKDKDLDKISGGADVLQPDVQGSGIPLKMKGTKSSAPEDPPIGGSPGVEQEPSDGGLGDEGSGGFGR